MGTGLGVPSTRRVGRGAQGARLASKGERGCYGARRRRLARGEERTGGGRLGELAARGGKVRAAGPTQPSPGHGGRVQHREEKSGGERKGASSPRRRGTPGGTRLRRRCWRGGGRGRGEERRRGRKIARRAVRGRCTVAWASWLPGAWAHLSMRRWARNGLLVVRVRARDLGRATAGPRGLARSGGCGGHALGHLGARSRDGRGWELGRARVGPGKEKGALGRAGGGGRGRRGRGGPAEWATEGGKLISFLFFSFSISIILV
jgi:hypothetical protein